MLEQTQAGAAKALANASTYICQALIGLVLVCHPSAAQQLTATIQKDILILPPGSGEIGPLLSSTDVTVLFGEKPQSVVAVDRLRTGTSRNVDWRIVIYADPALSTPEGFEKGLELLASQADTLTRLGRVQIVVADPFAEILVDPTQDVEEVLYGLDELAEFEDGAGEVVALRSELADLPTTGSLDAENLQMILSEEGSLQSRQRSELLAFLSDHPPTASPSALILLQDGYDLNPIGALTVAPPSDIGDQAYQMLSQEQMTLAAVLASQEWLTLSLAPPLEQDGLLKSREDALSMLTGPTGGWIVASKEGWNTALRSIDHAYRLRAQFEGFVDGLPRPLVVRKTDGQRLRTAQWMTLGTPLPISEIRAYRELDDPGLVQGLLEIRSILSPDSESAPLESGLPAILEVLVPLSGFDRNTAIFRISVLVTSLSAPPSIVHQLVQPGVINGTSWLFRTRVALPEETEGAVVVIEDLKSGSWGSTVAEPADQGFSSRSTGIVEWNDPSMTQIAGTTTDQLPSAQTPSSQAPSAQATSPQAQRSQTRAPASPRGQDSAMIRLLPPRRRPAKGKVKLNTLVGSPIVQRVDFYLDGEKIDSDDRAPFAGSADLGDEVATHLIKAVAFASGGALLGEHEVTLNPGRDTFQVQIVRMEEKPNEEAIEIEAEVRLPVGVDLERVEFFQNDTIVEVRQQPPFKIKLPSKEATSQDFVRVVAYLRDGTWIDDAQLLTTTGLTERLEVNLVELHVMVTDRQGEPVTDLTQEDFKVQFQGTEQTIERLVLAEEVPLVLGLVVDTSESMWPLMPDTKRAGAQFLTASLDAGDSAFLVDFDTKPRLAHGITEEVIDILRVFNSLEANGYTALYDATIFSMLQFEDTRGRKALVVLTDGDDYKSRYGPRRCVQYGRRLGVPVYVISLAGIQNPRRNSRRIELEGLAEATGGQVFYIGEMSELGDAYAHINRELRSQYVLTFSTDGALLEEELDTLDVGVAGRGLDVRAIVGGQQVQ